MNTDVLIIGSGPIGATYARLISEQKPNAKILMIDLGPRLTKIAGQHIKNIENEQERESAQIASQGDSRKAYPLITINERAMAAQKGTISADLLARPGTHLVTSNIEDLSINEMPAASLSSNVGGMGAHWTCACPRPGNEERINFIPEDDYERIFSKAEELLCVTQKAFPESAEGNAILNIVGDIFRDKLSANRQVQPMPLACVPDDNAGQYWVGSDVILGDLVHEKKNFTILSDTICRKLIYENGKVCGALIEHLPDKKQEEITAKIVIVAADALRTPQLLWASKIRPKALGHYLNEHPFIFTFVELHENLVDKSIAPMYDQTKRSEPTIGVFWVPFDAPNHPFHCQIMHMDVSPLKIETNGNPKHIVGLGYGCLKESRFEDHIVFSETEKDYLGMPKMNFKYEFTPKDLAQIEAAKIMQAKVASAFGKVIKEGEQTTMPTGTSLHYSGTIRMGETNDGTSVCDTYSKVWGFDNLFVGGNGVIPVATTSNPTLTSVALAVRSAEKVIELL
ncbi:MAG: GMC oxidoreductase [Arcicella sp.]|nr:GMC oxidoreductase [Arcicella sp.]